MIGTQCIGKTHIELILISSAQEICTDPQEKLSVEL